MPSVLGVAGRDMFLCFLVRKGIASQQDLLMMSLRDRLERALYPALETMQHDRLPVAFLNRHNATWCLGPQRMPLRVGTTALVEATCIGDRHGVASRILSWSVRDHGHNLFNS